MFATHTSILTSVHSTAPSGTASSRTQRSPTRCIAAPPRLRWLALAPLHFPRRTPRPVSYYALFKGWLLLSQPPGCLYTPTSFATQPAFQDLSRRSGLFPSRRRISSFAVRLPRSLMLAFGVWLGSVGLRPLAHPVLYLQHSSREASPKAISGRTSYLQVRLAYHPYPQFIPPFCNRERFGPPRGFSLASAWTWVAHLVSCLLLATALRKA